MDKTSKNLFNNTKLAFTNKSNLQLKKAFFLFSVLDYPVLTKLGNSFLLLVLKLNLPFKGIIKKTIFNHFCGGETIEECDDTFKSLNKYNILQRKFLRRKNIMSLLLKLENIFFPLNIAALKYFRILFIVSKAHNSFLTLLSSV